VGHLRSLDAGGPPVARQGVPKFRAGTSSGAGRLATFESLSGRAQKVFCEAPDLTCERLASWFATFKELDFYGRYWRPLTDELGVAPVAKEKEADADDKEREPVPPLPELAFTRLMQPYA